FGRGLEGASHRGSRLACLRRVTPRAGPRARVARARRRLGGRRKWSRQRVLCAHERRAHDADDRDDRANPTYGAYGAYAAYAVEYFLHRVLILSISLGTPVMASSSPSYSADI